jgi:endopeptidase La
MQLNKKKLKINYDKIKLYKINYLQNKYYEVSYLISNLMNHINFLDSIYYIDFNRKNELLTELFNINKDFNSIYNNYLLNNIDNLLIFNNEQIIKIINDTDDQNLNLLFPINKLILNVQPFDNEINLILKILNNCGCSNLKMLFDANDINSFSINLLNLIDEINDIFIPTSLNIFNVQSTDQSEYYWRVPTIYSNEDILELTRELWIKNNLNSYYKIEGIFKSDILSVKLKTAQLRSLNLYNNKHSILSEIKNKNCSVDMNFAKKFLRYDYIGNIYCMNLTNYINHLSSSYNFYVQLTKSNFINIMKNFINNGTKLYNLYYIIFLLLLGNDDNADVASLLLNLTKEKKINSPNLFNLINRNLSFYMQMKIKKGSNNIKNELDKIKSITIETIDYKTQLLSMKNIPTNIKNITLEKIEEMKSQNNEFYKQKTFVEYIIKFPWSSSYIINNHVQYLSNLKEKLDNLTYGHSEPKNILLETIANWISNPDSCGRPLGFVGPPGVGKTLLAKSISKAMDIPFAEITLGGQNDGELLHGHGYTYSGSQPGLIIKKMVEMGKDRCILYFDELDKTTSKHGSSNEISNILIHLTDPNMNKSFQDRFFQGINFPLDKVIMIFSYNDSDKIDPILLDRLREIRIKPYTMEDKLLIVRDFIIPELKSQIPINITINDKEIEYIIDNYTNEAGTRNIKRKIEKIFMTLNLESLTNKIDLENYILTKDEIIRILLKPENQQNKIHDKPQVGIINGLYATTNGDGGIIPIQIFNNFTSQTFEIKLTGKQGDVMKESVHCSLTCAINFIKNNLTKYGIDNFENYFQEKFKNGFHIHAPDTATPKDGPSAGFAFTCAFISRILNKEINNKIGMTGEIDLTGKITKIGGLNFKLIGAKKAGIKIVYVPKENKEDLDDIIDKHKNLINEDFSVHIVEYLDELIDKILI